MNNRRIPKDIVRAGFGNKHEPTCLTAADLICLLLGSELSRHTSARADHVTIIISFTVVLLRRSLAPNCSRPARFMQMIMKRIFKVLPSNVGSISICNESLGIPSPLMRFQHCEPYIGVDEFTFAVNRMLAPCLRGEIRVSFSEIMHALYIIQKHMSLAYDINSDILIEIFEEEEQRSWRVAYTGCCPSENVEIQCIYDANEHFEEFQRRFSCFLEECFFYFLMQIQRSFSQLQ